MSRIEMSRVTRITVHLKKWMDENNYDTLDIERAISQINVMQRLGESPT